MTTPIARKFLTIWISALALFAAPVAAHLTPNSEVQLDPRRGEVLVDIIVPLGEYAYVTGNATDGSAASLDVARKFLANGFRVSGPGDQPWTVVIDKVEFIHVAGPPDLHATARMIPPQAVVPGRFSIDWQIVVDRLPSHFALFVLAGAGDDRKILGAVRQGQTRLEINLQNSSTSGLLSGAIAVGAQHIIGGYDHILFLLALLLPAPLIARGGRWSEPRGWRDTIGKLVRIVTAFTIGHSLTLIGATMGGWKLPVAPVEIAIAVSVLVSALHSIRPLVPGREPIVAAGFGLVHGLAFATLVLQADAEAASSVASLLGFNLGIELAQLGMVLAVAPSLIILSRGTWYAPIRVGLAGFAIVAAGGWILNRATGAGDGFVARIEGLMSHAVWAVAILSLAALLSTLYANKRSAPPRAS
jgi:hypothetical protein